MDNTSGVGVLDKAVALMDAIATGPRSLGDLVDATGITRPTAHRLALALEHWGMVTRDHDGRFVPGPHLQQWTNGADALALQAGPVVNDLRDATGLSAQVYRRIGDSRVCIAAAEPATGLRDTVPVGSILTLQAGSAAQILVAWAEEGDRARLTTGAAYLPEDLARVRRRGWAHSLGQREPGVGSISAPVRDRTGAVVAAASISGPQERLIRPTRLQRDLVESAAQRLSLN